MKRKPRSHKRFIRYLDIAEAVGLKKKTVRIHAKGNNQRPPRFDPKDVLSLVEYVADKKGWKLIKPEENFCTERHPLYDQQCVLTIHEHRGRLCRTEAGICFGSPWEGDLQNIYKNAPEPSPYSFSGKPVHVEEHEVKTPPDEFAQRLVDETHPHWEDIHIDICVTGALSNDHSRKRQLIQQVEYDVKDHESFSMTHGEYGLSIKADTKGEKGNDALVEANRRTNTELDSARIRAYAEHESMLKKF